MTRQDEPDVHDSENTGVTTDTPERSDATGAKYLFVGGLVAMGFDKTGQYLLVVSHSGRGVFTVGTWERVARDKDIAYPVAGNVVGIGPLHGQVIEVLERNERDGRIATKSPDGKFHLLGESDGITITAPGGGANEG